MNRCSTLTPALSPWRGRTIRRSLVERMRWVGALSPNGMLASRRLQTRRPSDSGRTHALPLLGERAGVRASVSFVHFESRYNQLPNFL